jgi:anti-sigma factor (TIGR02949 family)
MPCGCDGCEEMMQPYLDGVLSDEQVREAKEHLERCPPCDKRYRFEVTLRRYVRVAVSEPIPVELKAKLIGLRSSVE